MALRSRQQHAAAVAEALRVVRLGEESAVSALRALLIEALSESQQDAYEWVEVTGQVTARELADNWQISLNYASTLLNELWQFGLLIREAVRDAEGRAFVYEVREEA